MVISLSEFNSLNEKEKKKTLQELKSEVGVSGLVEAWSVSRAKIYSMLHELNIPVNPRKPRKTGANPPDILIKHSSEQKQSGRERKSKKQSKETNPEMMGVYDVISADGSKFSLSLDTQGHASAISQTIQLLLSSGKFENTNLHLNLRLEEI